MPKKDPRVDAYIREAAPFARPVLKRMRAVIRASCPQAEETIKWGMPTFMYSGKILCGMAAFKAHCSFWFRRGSQVMKNAPKADEAMGQLGRITTVDDLPAKLGTYVKKAARLNEKAAEKMKRSIPNEKK